MKRLEPDHYIRHDELVQYQHELTKKSYQKWKKLIDKLNNSYIQFEKIKTKELLDCVKGYPLDEEQRLAVLTDERYQLIVAGAGSGKSLTIIGKIRYLVEWKKVPLSQILCISFTNDATNSLKESLKKSYQYDMEVLTFHKLAMKIIRENGGKVRIADDTILEKTVENFLNHTIFNEKDAQNWICQHFFHTLSKKDQKNVNILHSFPHIYYKIKNTTSFFLWKRVIMTFIHHMKSNENKLDQWIAQSKKWKHDTEETGFLKIIQMIAIEYESYLNKYHMIDFDDMMTIATKLVKEKKAPTYQYIIVDEYQDTSNTRYQLLHEIIQKTGASFIAVGDNFQSIYRFTGCDLNIFLKFQEYFGYTKILKIQNTYRNGQELIQTAGAFVMRNPKQMKKILKSNIHIENPIEIYFYEDFMLSFCNVLESISDKEIFILGRNNLDKNIILNDPNFIEEDSKIKYIHHPEKEMTFHTVHTSKGLETDSVILINLSSFKTGFPTQLEDDDILKYVRKEKDSYPYEEERRLFYVALTRTRHKVYLLVPKKKSLYFCKRANSKEQKECKSYVIMNIGGNMYQYEDLRGKLIIVETSEKNRMLSTLSKEKNLINLKLMDPKTFFEHLTFTITKQALYFLMKEYQISYDVAKEYLDNMKYILDIQDSRIPNIKKLSEMKQKLEENNLLKKDPYFLEYIKHTSIVWLTRPPSKWQIKILKLVGDITIPEIKIENKPKIIYEFETIEEELVFLATHIAEKIESGIDINSIILLNVKEEYHVPLKRIFRQFGLPVQDSEMHSLFGVPMVVKALSLLEQGVPKEELSNVLFIGESEQLIWNCFNHILNQYYFCEIDSISIECLKVECKKTRIPISKIKNEIQIGTFDLLYRDDEYIYAIGMNQQHLPIIEKDEQYFNQEACQVLEIDTIKEKNECSKNWLIHQIMNIPNLTMTYKNKTPFQTYTPTSLVVELGMKVIHPEVDKYKYSDTWNALELTRQLDRNILYHEEHPDLNMLYNHYNIPYQTYDHTYHTIDTTQFLEKLNNKLLLSYSSLDHYFRCGFRYYIDHVLKLNSYQETFAIKIGNLFHYFLSIAFEPNFDFEQEWIKYHQGKCYSSKEKFFLKKLKEELYFVIDTIVYQNQFSELDQECYEQKIYNNYNGSIQVTFMGVIDKIKYLEQDGIKYVAIIDYKTGMLETNLNECIYGINMQLPIYLYLVQNKPEWNHIEVAGFYLQKIITTELSNTDNKDYIQMKRDSMKLEGYSIDQQSILEKFDRTYQESRVIKSMKTGNNGFYAYSKTMSKEKMNRLVTLVENKIKEATESILRCDFSIHPKQIGSKLSGCEYCRYQDLCFKTEKDIIYKKEYKNLEFLGEDSHESMDQRTI